MDCSLPGSSVHGISQTRILAWVPISFSRGSSRPRDRTCVSCIGRWILYRRATWDGGEVGETQRGKLQAPLQAHREDSGCMKAPASFWKRIRCDKVLEPSALLKRSSVLSVKLRFRETRPMASAAAPGSRGWICTGSWGGGRGRGRPEVLRGLVPERKVQSSCVSPTAQGRFFHLVPPKLEGSGKQEFATPDCIYHPKHQVSYLINPHNDHITSVNSWIVSPQIPGLNS